MVELSAHRVDQKQNLFKANHNFVPRSENVGWVDISSTSRPVQREVKGRVLDNVIENSDGTTTAVVHTFVLRQGEDKPLSLLGALNHTTNEKESIVISTIPLESALALDYSEIRTAEIPMVKNTEVLINH